MKTYYSYLFVLLVGSAHAQGIDLPYSTGFDNTSQQSGWTQYHTGDISLYDWSFGGGGVSSSNCLSHDYNVGGAATDTLIDWMVSPSLNLSAEWQVSLVARRAGFSNPFDDNCEVWYSSGSPDPAQGDFILLGNLSFVSPQGVWVDTTFTGPELGSEAYIAFKYKTIGAAWSTYSIDEVELSISTGIETSSESVSMMSLYPQPASNWICLEIPSEDFTGGIHIMDASGRSRQLAMELIGERARIDCSSLSSGTYILECRSSGGSIFRRSFLVAR